MKILCFIVIVLCLGIGCKPRPIFECPKCIKVDSIIRITDTVAYAFPDELTLQALAYCDSSNKLVMRERDSIANRLSNLTPVIVTKWKVFETKTTVKEVDKNALKAAWEQGAKYIISQAKEKSDFITWKNIIAASIVLLFLLLIYKILKNASSKT